MPGSWNQLATWLRAVTRGVPRQTVDIHATVWAEGLDLDEILPMLAGRETCAPDDRCSRFRAAEQGGGGMKASRGSNPTLKFAVALAAIVSVMIAIAPAPIGAQDDDKRNLRAMPFVFVGKPGDCGEFPRGSGTPYPAGANVVTSAWLRGMGLPDNGGQNVGVIPTDTPNKKDPRRGLVLSKNATTLDCSVAGARIRGVRGMTVDAAFVLGFDYRNGSHCGSGAETGFPVGDDGAPHFHVVVENSVTGMESNHSVSDCNTGTHTRSQQDGQWSTLTWTADNAVPPIPPGSTIRSITLLYDEGTDRPSVTPFSQDVSSIGLAVLDNININGEIIRSGHGIAPPAGGDGDDDGDNDRRDGRR